MSFDQEFFLIKIKTLFSRFDLDGNGTIEESDFNKWADKLVSFGNMSGDNEAKLRQNIKSLWNEYFAPADVNGDGSISCNELVDHIKKIVSDEEKRALLRQTLPLIFDAIDCDKDDSVSKVEFANYFKSLNINDQSVADQVFTAMDVNSDGTLSKQEFAEFGKNFFISQDKNDASRLFFGPLVN